MRREDPAFKIKNANLPVLILHLKTTDLHQVKMQLAARINQIPDFFAHTPVALGLAEIANIDLIPDFADLLTFMRTNRMNAIGIMGGSAAQQDAAIMAGLGVIPEPPPRPSPSTPTTPTTSASPSEADVTTEIKTEVETKAGAESETAAAMPPPQSPPQSSPPPQPMQQPDLPGLEVEEKSPKTVQNLHASAEMRPTLVIDKPVRTGQRIYAEGGNLVVLAIVNAGAELIADGDIHIYAPLRGRALAGARGNTAARIYVQSMEAELVAVAGYFQVFDEGIPDSVRGKFSQISLEGERVIVAPMASMR
jgi:septum site-determining protein MinC